MEEVKKKNIILVPTDFSAVAENALGHAIQIAKLFDNEIALLHIIEESFFGSILSSKVSFRDQLIEEALNTKLDFLVNDIQTKHNIKVNKIIREGKIYKTIVQVADELGCDSIVMGSNGASGVDQIIGSNASRVIKYSNVPVVVVKENPIGNGYKDIVLPLDLTLESKQKVWWAIHLSKTFRSTVHIVIQPESDEFLGNKLNANLAQVENILKESNIPYTAATLPGEDNFAIETIRYAEEINADLIMIMTQQDEKAFKEYIMGSYAQQIVNKVEKTPVMCINPRKTGFVMEGTI